jgi:membrane protein
LRFNCVKPNKLTFGFVFGLVKEAAAAWMEDNALRLSAALAYYSIFSIAPLLLIAIGIAGFFGQHMSPEQIANHLTQVMGPQMAQAVAGLVESASKTTKSATIVGVITLLVGASGIFGQLKDALNTIWEVKQKPGAGIKGFIRERLLSFGMVLVIGFLLLVSLLLSAALTLFSGMLEHQLGMPPFVAGIIGFAFSFAVVTLLFALIFKVLPDVKVEWRSVWIGATVTALLFELGKWGLSLYLGGGGPTSSFGAAGSIVLVLLWVYYTSLILFFGAEFTQVYAKALGHEIQPSEHAEPVTTEQRAQEGLAPGSGSGGKAKPEKVYEPVIVPVMQPTPATQFPKTFSEVPRYLTNDPVAATLTAIGTGFLVGMLSRATARQVEPSPLDEISHGSQVLLSRAGKSVGDASARGASWFRKALRR